ncbi:MAG: MtrB/PioB family decaheme-associated outer membrane protein [Ramlibacter sp.]
MTSLVRPIDARLSLLALALLSAFGSVQAQVAPAYEASASIGIGVFSGDGADRSIFNQYNGLRPGANGTGLGGADYYRRDDEKGTSTQFRAIDEINGPRELGFQWKRQGDWKFSADYREIVRRDPNTPNTGVSGGGTTTPLASPLLGGPGTGNDYDLKTKRQGLGFGFSKVLTRQWQFDVSLNSENKEGSRLFGIGMACPSAVAPGCRPSTGTEAGSAMLMLPEPIDSNHSQAEARFTFSGEQLSLSAGYYGSFYRNMNGSMTPSVPGSLYNPLGALLPLSTGLQPILNQPVALPPDNQAHQLDLSGTYAFTRATQMNFKLGYSRAFQQDSFASAGFTAGPAGVSDLGGKLSTSLAQVGITSRPMPKLSLVANLRYEHRDDSTPLNLYNVEGTSTYTNRRYPLTTVKGKAEVAYQFNSDYRGLLGFGLKNVDRDAFTPSSAIAGVTALRQKTDENSVRAELRKRMAEDLSGAVTLESSRRSGSNWLSDNSGTGVTTVPDAGAASAGFANGIFPVNLADRRRDKVKFNADWQPTEKLSLQFVVESGRDRFSSPSAYGVRSADMGNASLDWNYAVTDAWNLNGFLSRGRQELDQARPGAAYMAYDNTANTVGIGFTGKATAKIDVGGTLSYMDERNSYAQTLDTTADLGSAALLAATGGLPNIVYRQTRLKLFGRYLIDKVSAVRVQFTYDKARWNDWAWGYGGTPYAYSDGTTVNRKQDQSVSFIGISYIHQWR